MRSTRSSKRLTSIYCPLSWRMAATLLLSMLAGCSGPGTPSGSQQEVVVYTSVDEVFARPVADRFQQETGITVQLVPDTEETKSTGLLNRLIMEKDRPLADVFWSGDPARAAVLKAKGVSLPYRSPESKGLPEAYSDPDGHWIGFSARARVLIYNHDLVPSGQEPKSVMDLVAPRFRGKACIANPLFGTTSMHAAALFQKLGDVGAKEFFEGYAANGGKILSSNGEVRRRVANGEFAVGIVDTDDYHVARQEGKPVGVVYPDADGMGTVLIPNCTVLIAHGPHPEAAKRFIDYLLRPETEQALAAGEAAQIPLRANVPVPADIVPLAKVKPMVLDYSRLENVLQEITRGYLKQWVDRNSR